MKLTLIIPTLWRIERATLLFERVLDDMRRGDELIVATDRTGCRAFRKKFRTKRLRCFETETEGYWHVMNESLEIARNRTFLWTADDINPHDGWLEIAREAFETNFPDGLGIVGMNDMIVGDATCGHAISTLDFLYVLFGEARFPEAFRHLYLDTMIADRAKSLKRFHYCYSAIAEHMHYSVKKSKKDALNHRNEGYNDKGVKDSMDQQWKYGGWQQARNRLAEFGNPDYVIPNVSVPREFRPIHTPPAYTPPTLPYQRRHVQSHQSRQSQGSRKK